MSLRKLMNLFILQWKWHFPTDLIFGTIWIKTTGIIDKLPTSIGWCRLMPLSWSTRRSWNSDRTSFRTKINWYTIIRYCKIVEAFYRLGFGERLVILLLVVALQLSVRISQLEIFEDVSLLSSSMLKRDSLK